MATESAPVNAPAGSDPPAAVPDVVALRACWHPVGFASAFGAEPVHATLLDEPLVIGATPPGSRTRCATSASIAAPRCPSAGWSQTG